MDKKDYRAYLNRWKLVTEIEEDEIRNSSFEFLLQQTLSIWDIGKSLGFYDQDDLPNPSWAELQRKWKEQHA